MLGQEENRFLPEDIHVDDLKSIFKKICEIIFKNEEWQVFDKDDLNIEGKLKVSLSKYLAFLNEDSKSHFQFFILPAKDRELDSVWNEGKSYHYSVVKEQGLIVVKISKK